MDVEGGELGHDRGGRRRRPGGPVHRPAPARAVRCSTRGRRSRRPSGASSACSACCRRTPRRSSEQVTRAYEAYQDKSTDLERHIYLRQLQDSNATLFYRLLLDHLAEMMPIIYTPTVGLACERFSHIIRRPRGLFIAYPERDDIDAILDNASSPQVEVIVVTDGERILGLGDQGAGGMGIPIGKLSLYTACGGIHPATTLPILLDAGTNNRERLDDPLYIGWRHERVTGAGIRRLRRRVRPGRQAAVPGRAAPVGGLRPAQRRPPARSLPRPALHVQRRHPGHGRRDDRGPARRAWPRPAGRCRDHAVAILGAGSAGCGIAEQLVAAMVEEGLPEPEARARFFLIDRQGLLHDGMDGLQPFQRKLAQPRDRVIGWRPADDRPIEPARRDRARAGRRS